MFCDGNINESELDEMLKEHDYSFKDSSLILCKFLDSHDSDRIFYKCKEDINMFNKVVRILTDNGYPYIWYYGTENMMTHNKSIFSEDYGDHMARLPMIFENEKYFYFFLNILNYIKLV